MLLSSFQKQGTKTKKVILVVMGIFRRITGFRENDIQERLSFP